MYFTGFNHENLENHSDLDNCHGDLGTQALEIS